MQVLKVIEQLGSCRKALLALIEGDWKAESVESEILRLKQMLDDLLVSKNLAGKVSKSDKKEQTAEKTDNSENPVPELGSLFINEGLRLLKVLEIDKKKKGVAFQEAMGFVIYIENSNLHTVSPVKVITDSHGMKWELFPLDLEGVKAVNEIGDEVKGFPEVQKLIDGGEALS